jgi:molybdopterin converting factor small subunit|tara:strand:- start:484 stop:717 length:234 start_codon:yes stop_codon:yes gene_type:complete
MEYTVRYYGQLSELVHTREDLIFSDADTIQKFIIDLIQTHPILKGKTFQVAQNNQIKREGELISKDVIDLFPQFSGG